MLSLCLLVVSLGALPADAPTADAAPAPAPAALAAPEVESPAPPSAAALAQARPTTGRLVLAVGAATLVTVAASVAAGFAGALVPELVFAAQGHPEPLAIAGGFVIGSAVQVALSTLLVPEVFRLGNDAAGHGSPGETRLQLWRLSRWSLLVAGVATLVFGVGALLERGAYGRGQALMIGGGATLFASWLVFDVTSIWGATLGYRGSFAPW